MIEIVAKVFVLCSCGRKHRLRPGVGAPYYWCEEAIRVLKVDDVVECEDVECEVDE